jgi:hypothetical protein
VSGVEAPENKCSSNTCHGSVRKKLREWEAEMGTSSGLLALKWKER